MGSTIPTKRALTASLAVLVAAGSIGTGIALAAGMHQTSSTVTVGVKHTSLGSILYAGPKHLTVYMYTKDHGTKTACTGECAKFWPAVTTVGNPKPGPGTVAVDLGTAKQRGGVTQAVYKGHLLYYYAADKSSSSTAGQGFDNTWFALSGSGAKIAKSASSGSTKTTKTPSPSGGWA